MREPSIEDVAERFDEVYTRMTGLQRRLIVAARDGLDDGPSRELVREAAAIVAAVSCAERASSRAGPSVRELEAEALRARVLVEPIDGAAVLAAARAQTRLYAYWLLAEVIEKDEAIDAWGAWRLRDVLSAPRGIGAATAQRLAEHAPWSSAQDVGELDAEARGRLVAALREWADGLPAEASGRATASLSDDGIGASADVLSRWVDPLGPASDPVRRAAREVSQRDGWPADAVPTAEALMEFTHSTLMPRLVPGFADIARAEASHEGLIAALRAEERGYSEAWMSRADPDDAEAERANELQWALRSHIEALQALRKAREQLGLPRDGWRGPGPLTHARIAARRCGEVLALFGEDVVELLGELPPKA